MENIKLDSILYNVSEIEKLECKNNTDSDYSDMYSVLNEEITNDNSYDVSEIEKSEFDTNSEYLYPPLIGNENLNGIVDMNRNLVLNQEENKISPYEVENLEERFNMKRFPDRIRREVRVLNKYNTLANYVVVIVYFLFKASLQHSKKSRLAHYAKLAHDLIDAPVNSLKAKISQLNRWDEMETNNQISYGLIDAYYKLANLDPNKLLTIIKNHGLTDAEKEKEINKLIKKDK